MKRTSSRKRGVSRAFGSAAGGGSAPTNLTQPTITPTSVTEGAVITVNTSASHWTGNPTSFRYQWIGGNGVDITGQTGSTYTTAILMSTRTLTCRVWASNAFGESSPVISAGCSVQASSGSGGSAVNTADIIGFAGAETPFAQQSRWIGQVLGTYPTASSISENGIAGPTSIFGSTLRFGKVADPVTGGENSLYFALAQSDPNTSGSKRCEIQFLPSQVPIRNRSVYWIGYKVYVYGWSVTNEEHIFGTQMHYADSIGGSPPIALYGLGNNYQVTLRYSTSTSPSNSNSTVTRSPLLPITFNGWMDMVFQYSMSSTSGNSSFCRVWENGVQKVNYSGNLGILDSVAQNAPGYQKFGLYCYNMPSGQTRRILLKACSIILDPTGSTYTATNIRDHINAN